EPLDAGFSVAPAEQHFFFAAPVPEVDQALLQVLHDATQLLHGVQLALDLAIELGELAAQLAGISPAQAREVRGDLAHPIHPREHRVETLLKLGDDPVRLVDREEHAVVALRFTLRALGTGHDLREYSDVPPGGRSSPLPRTCLGEMGRGSCGAPPQS